MEGLEGLIVASGISRMIKQNKIVCSYRSLHGDKGIVVGMGRIQWPRHGDVHGNVLTGALTLEGGMEAFETGCRSKEIVIEEPSRSRKDGQKI